MTRACENGNHESRTVLAEKPEIKLPSQVFQCCRNAEHMVFRVRLSSFRIFLHPSFCHNGIICYLCARMNYIIRYIILLFIAFTAFTSCSDELPPLDPVTPATRRTVLIYMVAENTLSPSTEYDINELEYAANTNTIPSDCNVLVYKDNTGLPSITLFNRLGVTTWKTWNKDQNSADSTVMLATLREMILNYPSQHYALVLWSHGSGWSPRKKTIDEITARQARAFGVDNGHNSAAENGDYGMNVSSVRWVLEKLGVRMDYILWDACLMQGIETAYELRGLTDWIIGAPTETPGTGAPYDLAVKGLCNADMPAILEAYEKYYDNKSRYTSLFPLSFIKTSELDALAEATAPYIEKYFYDKDHRPAIVNTAQVYSPRKFLVVNGNQVEVGTPIAYDMGSIMAGVLTPEEYDTWRKQLDKTVPYKTVPTREWMTSFSPAVYGNDFCKLTDGEHYSGISMNVPQDNYDIYRIDNARSVRLWWNTYYRTMNWWKAGGWSKTEWEPTADK